MTTVTNSSVSSNPDYNVKTSVDGGELVQHVRVDSLNSLESYAISDLDEAGATKYYGFLDASGNWYILQLTSTAARYIKGTTDYATNWTNRAGLTYDYYNVIF